MHGEGYHPVRLERQEDAATASCGTAFIGAVESLAGADYRRMLTEARTRLTGAISGRPARGLDNALMQWAATVDAPVPDYPLTYDGVKQLVAAVADPTFSVMWAGAGASRSRFMAAAELVRQIEREMSA